MNRIGKWLLAIFVASALVACGGGSGSSESKAKTTLMVYMVASNLVESAEYDIEHMLAAHSGKDVNVVLEIGGGTKPGSLSGVDMTQHARYQLKPNAAAEKGWSLVRMPAAQQPPQVAMNQPDTLRDFIKWSAQAFPADQYVLALWDHGGGPIVGFGNDNALGGGKAMVVNDIVSAIKSAGVSFELVGFDSCLMATLEVASMLSPYANYLVASEEVTTGWEWTSLVSHLVDHPQTSGADLGTVIVQSYKTSERTNGRGELAFTAYSVTDLKRVGAVVAVLDKAANVLQDAIRTQGLDAWWTIASARRQTEDFQTNVLSSGMDLVDVKSWFHELGNAKMLSAELVAEFDKVYAAALVYTDVGESDASGLMMFFPRYSTLNADLQGTYADLGFSTAYRGLISSYVAFARGAEMPRVVIGETQKASNLLTADVTTTFGALKSGKALPGQNYDRGYAVLIKDGKAQALQQIDGTANQLRMEDPNLWPMVDGQVVSLLPLDGKDEDDTFVIPVYSVDDEDAGLLYAFKDDDGVLRIRFYAGAQQVSGAVSEMLEVDEGDEYIPLVFDVATQRLARGASKLTAPAGDWVLKKAALMGSGYSVVIGATDLTGQLQWSTGAVSLPLAP